MTIGGEISIMTVWYHGTTTARLGAIAESGGLMPLPSHDNPDRTALYLTRDFDTAQLYAELACDRRGGDLSILVIDSSSVDAAGLSPDDCDLQQYIDDLHDPNRMDEIGFRSGVPVDERLRGFRHWSDVPWSLSLEVTGQVGYDRKIPTSAVLNWREEFKRASAAIEPIFRPAI